MKRIPLLVTTLLVASCGIQQENDGRFAKLKAKFFSSKNRKELLIPTEPMIDEARGRCLLLGDGDGTRTTVTAKKRTTPLKQKAQDALASASVKMSALREKAPKFSAPTCIRKVAYKTQSSLGDPLLPASRTPNGKIPAAAATTKTSFFAKFSSKFAGLKRSVITELNKLSQAKFNEDSSICVSTPAEGNRTGYTPVSQEDIDVSRAIVESKKDMVNVGGIEFDKSALAFQKKKYQEIIDAAKRVREMNHVSLANASDAVASASTHSADFMGESFEDTQKGMSNEAFFASCKELVAPIGPAAASNGMDVDVDVDMDKDVFADIKAAKARQASKDAERREKEKK